MSTLKQLKALEAKATAGPWYTVENDLIGGWLVATADKPASELRLADEERQVFDFASREDAEFVCALRNAWPEIAQALQTLRAR
jgi:hypothetical protein